MGGRGMCQSLAKESEERSQWHIYTVPSPLWMGEGYHSWRQCPFPQDCFPPISSLTLCSSIVLYGPDPCALPFVSWQCLKSNVLFLVGSVGSCFLVTCWCEENRKHGTHNLPNMPKWGRQLLSIKWRIQSFLPRLLAKLKAENLLTGLGAVSGM